MFEIYHNLIVEANANVVFSYITKPDLLNKWWTVKSTGNPELSAIYSFWFGPEYDWKARVTKLKKNQEIEFTMIAADEDWMDTSLLFQIKKEAEGKIRLHFYHSNWKSQNTHFGQTNYCWAEYLSVLKQYAER